MMMRCVALRCVALRCVSSALGQMEAGGKAVRSTWTHVHTRRGIVRQVWAPLLSGALGTALRLPWLIPFSQSRYLSVKCPKIPRLHDMLSKS